MQGLRGDYCVELGDLHWVMSEAQNGGDQTSKKSERVIGWEVRVGMGFWVEEGVTLKD